MGGRNSFNLPQGNVDTEIERPEYSFCGQHNVNWGKTISEGTFFSAKQLLVIFDNVKKVFIII